MKALELIHLRTAGVVQASQQFYHSATLGTLSSRFNLLKLKPAPLSVPSGESNNFLQKRQIRSRRHCISPFCETRVW